MTDSDTKNSKSPSEDPAVNLIRQKLQNVYGTEPNAKEEVQEVSSLAGSASKHQQYMQEISKSGKSLAEIQTAWHNYYVNLTDDEKHQVWKEFYAEHDKAAKPQPVKDESTHSLKLPETSSPRVNSLPAPQSHSQRTSKSRHARKKGSRSIADVTHHLTSKATASASKKLKAKQHFQSLLFGVGMGLLVVVVLLFGFFNDRFIAPLITPSKTVSNTPIILDDSNSSIGSEPKILIPKINVEIPVVYDEPSIEEHAVQNALERGVVHYATTPDPGQKGNAVIFGHSSNNILNKGKYKFAFVLLNRLENGDTFYLNKNGTRYAYRIYEKKVVEPTDVGVLDPNEKAATVTLITCDPPGTTLKRLIVVGEQISPDPSSNVASTATTASTKTSTLAGNAPSLWQRIKDWF